MLFVCQLFVSGVIPAGRIKELCNEHSECHRRKNLIHWPTSLMKTNVKMRRGVTELHIISRRDLVPYDQSVTPLLAFIEKLKVEFIVRAIIDVDHIIQRH